MSGCRHGGRDVPDLPPVIEVPEGIHGKVHWKDGTASELAFARTVNGVEREASYVELDGELFEGASSALVEHYRDGVRYAIDFDGRRWVPAREADFDDVEVD